MSCSRSRDEWVKLILSSPSSPVRYSKNTDAQWINKCVQRYNSICKWVERLAVNQTSILLLNPRLRRVSGTSTRLSQVWVSRRLGFCMCRKSRLMRLDHCLIRFIWGLRKTLELLIILILLKLMLWRRRQSGNGLSRSWIRRGIRGLSRGFSRIFRKGLRLLIRQSRFLRIAS